MSWKQNIINIYKYIQITQMKEPISIKKIEEPNSNELIQFITKTNQKGET